MLEKLYKDLENIYYNLADYFNKILDNEELSYYKGVLWIFKVNLLQLKQYEIGIDINNIDLEINQNKKKIRIMQILMYIISLITLFNFWPLGIISFGYTYKVSKDNKKSIDNMQNIFNKSRELFDKCDCIALNCQTFINKKMEISAERFNEQFNKNIVVDLEPYYYAQNLIDLYVNFDILMDTTPKVKEIVIKMLQSDLETSEEDFMTLLNIAREKVSEDRILEQKNKSNNIYQKYDESCRKLQKFYNKKRK